MKIIYLFIQTNRGFHEIIGQGVIRVEQQKVKQNYEILCGVRKIVGEIHQAYNINDDFVNVCVLKMYIVWDLLYFRDLTILFIRF